MERKSIGGLILLVIGIVMLFYVFYQGYLVYTAVSSIDFEATAQLSIPTPVGDIPIDLPGIGSVPIIMKAAVEAIYLGLLIAVGSKIAGIGINLTKK